MDTAAHMWRTVIYVDELFLLKGIRTLIFIRPRKDSAYNSKVGGKEISVMKKLLCLAMVMVFVLTMVFALPVSAATGKLTVTANGKNAMSYNVGDEIAFYVFLNAGDKAVLNGQAYVTYDSDLLEAVSYKIADSEGAKSTYAYSFPDSIYNSNAVLNLKNAGIIRYNFTKAEGVGKFVGNEKFFVRFHFKVKAAGTTDIAHFMQYMCDVDEGYIYFGGNVAEGASPELTARTMIAAISVGDVNADGQVKNKDALVLDRYIAGWSGYDKYVIDWDAADTNRDGKVKNKDALILDRYIAGWKGYDTYIISVVR